MRWDVSKVEHEGDAYFTVRWSPFAKADKYTIHTGVPAIAGIAELYWMDEARKLNLFCVARSWYGGLRSVVRARIDPELERDEYRRSVLEAHPNDLWYRYTGTDSHGDMSDLMYFFMETYAPGAGLVESSGRYGRIFVDEIDAGKLVTS